MNHLIAAIFAVTFVQCAFCAVSDNACGKSVGCFRLPANCKSADCDVFITYIYRKNLNSFDITLSSNHKWAAFAQAKELKIEAMSGIKGEACFNKNGAVHLVSLSATRNESPSFKATSSHVLNPITMKTNRGGIFCKYSRKASSKDDFMTSLDTKVYVFYAFGDNFQANGYPAYHGPGKNGHSVQAIDLKII